jgi:hypothetical protein
MVSISGFILNIRLFMYRLMSKKVFYVNYFNLFNN